MGSGTGSQAGMSRPAFGKVIFVQRPSETPIYTVPSLAKTQTSSPSQLSASLPQQFCSLWCVSLPSPQVVISWATPGCDKLGQQAEVSSSRPGDVEQPVWTWGVLRFIDVRNPGGFWEV